MSRIGKKPIQIPEGVEARLDGREIIIKGKGGELKQKVHPLVKVEIKDREIFVTVKDPEDANQNALWGLFGSLIGNMITGVIEGYEKKLEVVGVGYKVNLQGKKLVLNVGYSHPVEFTVPDGIEVSAEANVITLKGSDKQQIGEIAAQIRKIRKPEPYKGKGIKYLDEIIRKKAGKAAKSAG